MTELLYHEIMCPSLTKKGPCNCAPVAVAEQALFATLVDAIMAVPAVNICRCGHREDEHTYWADKIYDYNGYRCPDSLGGDFTLDRQLTAARLRDSRIAKCADQLAGLVRHGD